MGAYVTAGEECEALVAGTVRSMVGTGVSRTTEGRMTRAAVAARLAERTGLGWEDAEVVAAVGVDALGRRLAPVGLPHEDGDDGFLEDLRVVMTMGNADVPEAVRALLQEPAVSLGGDQARALAATVRSLPRGPDAGTARIEAAREGRLAPGDVTHRPIQISGIDASVLKAGDVILKRGTNGQLTSMSELLARLVDAEKGLAEAASNRVAVHGAAAPSDGAPREYAWRCRKVPLGQVVDVGRVRGDQNGPVAPKAVMDVMVDLWESTPPHPRVPPKSPNHLFEAETLATCALAMANGKVLSVVGPTGSGKTTLLRELAARTGRPFYKVPVDGEIRRPELIGTFKQVATPTGSETRWVDGLLLRAIVHPSVTVLDEFDRAEPNVLYAAHSVLEHDDFVVMEDGGRTVRMHPSCFVGTTSNTRGRSDGTGLYAMATELSEASRDRLSYWIDHDYLAPDDERDLLKAEVPGLTQGEAQSLATFAKGLRDQLKKGDIRTACSTRAMLDAAQLHVSRRAFDRGPIPIKRALATVVLNRAVDDLDAQVITQAMRTVFG